MLLAFDTSGLSCSVALSSDGQLWTEVQSGTPQHSRRLLPMIEQLLARAGRSMDDVSALAYGRGPGSFTGIRVAAGLAQGLGYSLGCPVLPVSTLAALAHQAARRHCVQWILTAIDARLGEVYWCAYQASGDGMAKPALPEQVGTAESVGIAPAQDWFGIGSGWQIADGELRSALRGRLLGVDAAAIPLAEDIATLAGYELRHADRKSWPAEAAQPIYLRDRVAHGS